MEKKALKEFKELFTVATELGVEAWGSVMAQAVLGDPDWFHDLISESYGISDDSPFWLPEYHLVFQRWDRPTLAKVSDQFCEYTKNWSETLEETKNG